MNRLRSTFVVVCTCVLLSTGLQAQQAPAAAEKTLFERLGGMPAIEAVANDLVDRILADGRVSAWFAHAASTPENTAAYKAKLASFLCQTTGGPCKYTGQDMVTAHRGRNVTSGAFDAVVEDAVATLDKLKVPAREKQEVLAALGPLKSSIVQR